MKRTMIKFLGLAVCLHGLAWHSVEQSRPTVPTTGYELIAAFSKAHAEALPTEYAQAAVHDLKVSERKISFRIKGFPMFVEWIGQPGRLLKFNNRIFTLKDFSSEESFRKAFMAKFAIVKVQKNSMNSLFFPRAFASIDDGLFSDSTAPRADSEDGDPQEDENDIGFNFEGQTGARAFDSYVRGNQVFTDDSLLGQTQAGQDFAARVGLTTGDSLMSMIRYAMIFNGTLGFAMNPAGGFNPGFGVMNNLGTAPSAVALPHRTMNN